MVTPVQAIQGFIDGVECFILANNPFVNGSASTLSPAARAVFNDRINQARRIRGCAPEDDTAPPPPPFEGGQCDFDYLFDVVGTAPTGINGFGECLGTQQSTTPGGAWGPISGFRRGQQVCGGGPDGDAFDWEITCFGLTNSARLSSPVTVVVATALYTASLQNVRPNNPLNTDECGDPEPIYPPPTTINIDQDITYEIEGDTNVTVNIPFVFAPIKVDFNGDLKVPFTFDLGGFEYSGDFSLNPEIPINIEIPGLNPGDGQGTEDLPPGDPENETDPEPEEDKIIGVVVIATNINQGKISSYFSPGIPEIYVPRLGSVKFAYNLGGTTFFSSDIDVKDRRTFIECPFSGGADAVIASPQTGVTFEFIPIRGFPLATKADIRRQS